MRIIECRDYDEMSQKAAVLIASQILLKPDSVLGLATGSTPVGMYNRLANMDLDFSEVTTFNLDEYYPIKRTNDQSYFYFMNKNLFSRINMQPDHIHIPNGEAADPGRECEAYEAAIAASGGIDIQVLGIGQNGHIGFNEPDEELYARTHRTGLTESTIEANARFFACIDDVPRHALTMGVSTIMKAKKILLLANGSNKSEALQAVFSGKISPHWPASILAAHSDVVVLADREALGR